MAGCSTAPFIPPANSGINQTQLITAPFYPQQKYQCGPAALASVLNFQQVDISVEALVEQIYIPSKKGSLQLEIKAAIRRANLLPYELPSNLQALLTQVSDGQPVLVLQNLGLNFWPQWHYAVVVGFDLNQQTITLHSGTYKNYSLGLRTFINTWERANSWAVAAIKPTTIPKHLNGKNYITAATGLEAIGKQTVANQAYQSALEQWPSNNIALLGAGNQAYQQGHFMVAIEYYLHSLQSKADDAASWNNLAFALAQQQCPSLANQAIAKALALSNQNANYQQNQNEINALTQNSQSQPHCQTLQLP